MSTYNYDRWPIIMAIYPDDSTQNSQTTVTPTTINITNDNETYTVSYIGKSVSEIVSEFNGNLTEHNVVKTLDIGVEQIVQSSIVGMDGEVKILPGSPLAFHYGGFISRSEERSVIQLKPPRSQSRFESWYPRVGKGKIRSSFQGINFQGYPGINPDATYEFSVPEFMRQEWSPNYGPPYKDVVGEIPEVVRYHPRLNATVLRVARRPIYWDNRNISITLEGRRQANSFIKDVDENNGLIYINQKLGKNINITIDYSFEERDYVYDAVDLNASLSHNPLIVDTYVAFYLKPTSANSAIISGGDAVFHEIVTTEAAGRSKVARIIPATIGSATPLYEPVIYLGSMNVRQAVEYDEYEIIDTRTRGGGIYPDKVDITPKTWREAEFFYDIGSFDGPEVPGNAAIVMELPDEIASTDMTTQEIEERATRDVAMGVVPIIEYGDPIVPWTESLTFGDDDLTVMMAAMSPAITMSHMTGSNGFSRDFYPEHIFGLVLEPNNEDQVTVPGEELFYVIGSPTVDTGALVGVTPNDFTHRMIRNYGTSLEVIYSGLNVNSVNYPNFTAVVSGEVRTGECYWNIYVDPKQDNVPIPERWRLRGVEFPRILPERAGSTFDTLVTPYRGGLLAINPHSNFSGDLNVVNPSIFGQYWAEYDEIESPEKGMLYWQTLDESRRPGATVVAPTYGTGSMRWSHGRLRDKVDELVGMWEPYEFKMALITGDWYDAVRHYKTWCDDTWLAPKPRLFDTTHTGYQYPSWFTGVSAMARYGPYSGFIPNIGATGEFNNWTGWAQDANRLRSFCQSGEGTWITQIGGWHKNEFDNDWPNFYPIDTTLPDAINLVRTGEGGPIKIIPYAHFFYSATGVWTVDNDLTNDFTKLSDGTQRFSVLGQGADPAGILSIQDTGLRAIMVDPWSELYTGAKFDGYYMDFWAGVAGHAADYSTDIPNSGSYSEYSEAALHCMRDLILEMRSRSGDVEWPIMTSEGFDERYFGIIPTMYMHGGIGPADQSLQNLFGHQATTHVPACNVAYGSYQLPIDVSPSLGAVANEPGMNTVLDEQAWHLHFGKLPASNASWTGENQGDITVYATTGNTPFIANWQFHREICQQFEPLNQYVYQGDRLRPYSGLFIESTTVGSGLGFLTGGWVSFWSSTGDHVGMVVTSSDTGIVGGIYTRIRPNPNYPELEGKTGLIEITDGGDVWRSSFEFSGDFRYTTENYTGTGVRVFEFR